VAKKHFVILQETNDYPMVTQAKIVSACGVIHNFIATYDSDDLPEPWALRKCSHPLLEASGLLGSGTIGGPETHQGIN